MSNAGTAGMAFGNRNWGNSHNIQYLSQYPITSVGRGHCQTWNKYTTDHEADLEVGEKDERDDEDADHGEGQVAPQLEHDHLVRLPRRVDLKEEQGEWRGGMWRSRLIGWLIEWRPKNIGQVYSRNRI